MSRLIALAMALAFAAGCVEMPYEDTTQSEGSPYGATTHSKYLIESEYRSYLYDLEKGQGVEADPEATRFESLADTVKRYEKQATIVLLRVVTGLPPRETTAGYIKRVIYPKVILYNRDTGKHESVAFEFNYVYDADLSPLPKGVIHGNGRTMLIGRGAGNEWFLGRFELEAGALLVLHVCPCCGVKLPEKAFLSIARPDISPENAGRFKEEMVKAHVRQNEGYSPVAGLPEEFWRFPHDHSCAAAGEKEYGEQASIPVRLEQVKSSEMTSMLKAPAEGDAKTKPAEPAEPAEGEGEGGGAEGENSGS